MTNVSARMYPANANIHNNHLQRIPAYRQVVESYVKDEINWNQFRGFHLICVKHMRKLMNESLRKNAEQLKLI